MCVHRTTSERELIHYIHRKMQPLPTEQRELLELGERD